jgi:hypothetical protein
MNATQTKTIETLRAEYRALRASCKRHDAKRFDRLAEGIWLEMNDGEDFDGHGKAEGFVHAAHIIVSGQDHA